VSTFGTPGALADPVAIAGCPNLITPASVLLALGFSAAVGVFFGIDPTDVLTAVESIFWTSSFPGA
jgi:hypothetical protein